MGKLASELRFKEYTLSVNNDDHYYKTVTLKIPEHMEYFGYTISDNNQDQLKQQFIKEEYRCRS